MCRGGVLLLTLLLLLTTTAPSTAGNEEKRAAEPPGGMPPEERLEPALMEWLGSGDELHAAWAGWIVAERRIGALAGAVRHRLVRSASGQGPRRHGFFLDAALLDALVRTGATAPGETLTHLAGAHVEAVTVLLCRRHEYDPAHLAVFDRVRRGTDREAYVALGNALAAWRVPDFTARILGSLELRRRVRIWDEDPPYPPFRGPSDSVPGDGFFRLPEGYPPVATYALSFRNWHEGSDEQISRGHRPVFAHRRIARAEWIGFGATGVSPEPRHEYRHEWLTAFLAEDDVPALPIWALIDIKWTGGPQPWIRRTRQAIEDLHETFRTWRDSLHGRDLLTDEDRATVRPKIELRIVDERRYRDHPLPPFPEVPFDPRVPARRRRLRLGDV